ncbi:MAG: sulfite exporter TauE/SafE family protein [Verrucomicrobiales bacterium]
MLLLQDISSAHYALALFGAFCLGFSKTGFPGLAIVNVLLIAELFGAKRSVGIILPLLVVCDLVVYPLFRRHASWRAVLPLIPPAMLGVVAGYFALDTIDDATARRTIGSIILVMLIFQLLRAHRREFLAHLPDSKTFLWGSGLTIGVSTMMANAAGPVYSIYALIHRMPKNEFLGIGARFFLFINLFKIPFNANLGIINPQSLRLDLALLPGIFAGIFLGRRLIEKVPQNLFEILLYGFSVLAGVRLLFF